MPNATLLLAVIALGAVVLVLGTERTAAAAGTAASGTKQVATSSWTAGVAGLGIGLELGYQIVQAVAMEPFAFTTALAGLFGALGIEGYLGDLTGVQFLLIGLAVFASVVYMDRRRR